MRWLRDMWRRDVWRRDCNRWWNVHPGWWADGFPVIDKREWFRQSDLQDILASSNWALRRDLRTTTILNTHANRSSRYLIKKSYCVRGPVTYHLIVMSC